MGLIDFHAHLEASLPASDRLLAAADRYQIEQIAVVAGRLLTPQVLSRQMANGCGQAVEAPNRELLQICHTSGGRLLPFYFANPHSTVNEYVAIGAEFVGLKLGPAIHGIALTDASNRMFIEMAQQFQHPVYLHCLPRVGFDVEALRRLACVYPRVQFILGHAGIGNCDFHAVDGIREFSNIAFETSGGFSSVVTYALSQLGRERILFGTEYPLQDPSLEIAKMRSVDLSESQLNENARRLLKLEVARG